MYVYKKAVWNIFLFTGWGISHFSPICGLSHLSKTIHVISGKFTGAIDIMTSSKTKYAAISYSVTLDKEYVTSKQQPINDVCVWITSYLRQDIVIGLIPLLLSSHVANFFNATSIISSI